MSLYNFSRKAKFSYSYVSSFWRVEHHHRGDRTHCHHAYIL